MCISLLSQDSSWPDNASLCVTPRTVLSATSSSSRYVGSKGNNSLCQSLAITPMFIYLKLCVSFPLWLLSPSILIKSRIWAKDGLEWVFFHLLSWTKLLRWLLQRGQLDQTYKNDLHQPHIFLSLLLTSLILFLTTGKKLRTSYLFTITVYIFASILLMTFD